MPWADQQATGIQVSRLKQLGYAPDHPLTKGEALQLIREIEEHPEKRLRAGRSTQESGAEAWRLRSELEQARREVAGALPGQKAPAEYRLSAAVSRRQEFWMDSCREPGKMRNASAQAIDLYMKHGCRFSEPARGQVLEILVALDGAAPCWDRDYPELFYQTLELNFRELLRRAM